MNSRTLQVIGLVAVATLGLGVFLSSRDKGSDTAASKALLPVLEKRINDVAAVRIEGGDSPLTLKKDGDSWKIEEKSGFPADGAKVRQLLFELRLARKIEQKTASASGFETLGVQEPNAEGSESKEVILLDAKGAEITRLIVGKRRFGKGSATGPVRADDETYVRVAGDSNAWLAAGKLNLEANVQRWLDAALFDVARDRLAAVEYHRAEGEDLVLARATKEATELEPVTAVPEGRELKQPSATAQVLNALGSLRFDDVAGADKFEWPATADVTTKFWTFDGLELTAETVERDGKTWAKFHAAVAPKDSRPRLPGDTGMLGPVLPPEALPNLDAAALGEGDEGVTDTAPVEPPKPVGPTPEELAAEAKKINDKVEGWIFAVPSWKANSFKMKVEDILAPLPEPVPVIEEGGEGPGGDGGVIEDDGEPIELIPLEIPGGAPGSGPVEPPVVPPPAGGGSGDGG